MQALKRLWFNWRNRKQLQLMAAEEKQQLITRVESLEGMRIVYMTRPEFDTYCEMLDARLKAKEDSLPTYQKLTEEDVKRVTQELLNYRIKGYNAN